MLYILHAVNVNWFYETLAVRIATDLRSAGIETRLITLPELLALASHRPEDDFMAVNLSESARIPDAPGYPFGDLPNLREKMKSFRRRILLILECISTNWFHEQLEVAGGALTDIFDVGMVSQTTATTVAGCNYHWIPECFTREELSRLPAPASERPVPWAVIGHQTPERAALVDSLVRQFASNGLVFLPAPRPYTQQGAKNFALDALDNILRKTQFYIWTSHHKFPYHEGVRAIHALQNGCVPVKICPDFASRFKNIPWVYPGVPEFVASVRSKGHQHLLREATEFVTSHGALADHLLPALQLSPPAGGRPGAAPSRTLESAAAPI